MLVNFFTTTIRIPMPILVINKLHIKYLKFGLQMVNSMRKQKIQPHKAIAKPANRHIISKVVIYIIYNP